MLCEYLGMSDGCGMWVPIRYMSILECHKGVVWVVCIIGVISCGGFLAPNLERSSTVSVLRVL